MIRKIHIYLFAVIVILSTYGCVDETKVKSVSLNPEEMTLSIGETRQIELTINPISSAIYNSKIWSSSNQNVAVVDNKGNVTAVYAGTCVITATVDGHRARCKVTVETPSYELEMSEGAVYTTGVDDETGAMTQIVRLFDDGLTMNEDGEVTGNGMMINVSLCSPVGTDTLSEGKYIVEESHREMTVKPGEMKEEDGKNYVTGSFLGQYTDDGLVVLLLTAGNVNISKDEEGRFTIDCQMEGAQQEIVNVKWQGKPTTYKSEAEEPERIYYEDMVISDTVMESETNTRHTLVTLTDGKSKIRINFRLPLSTEEQLLAGRYSLSDQEVSYTISPEGSFIEKDGKTIDLQSANINVTQKGKEYLVEGSIKGEDEKDYVVKSGKE